MRGWQIAKIAGIAIEINATWLFIFALLLFGIADDHLPRHYPDAARWQFWMAGTTPRCCCSAPSSSTSWHIHRVARRYGVQVSRITLFIFGGVAQTEGEPKTALSELWIALAGPLASMVVGAVCLGVWWLIKQSPIEPVWGGIFRINGALNIALAAFNMLPGFPLDGGRVLRASIWHFTGDLLNSTWWATVLGRGLGYLMMFSGALSLAAGNWLNGLYALGLGLAQHRRQGIIREHTHGRAPEPDRRRPDATRAAAHRGCVAHRVRGPELLSAVWRSGIAGCP